MTAPNAPSYSARCWLDAWARHGDEPILEYESGSLEHRVLSRRVRQHAAFLQSRGIGVGDRVAIVSSTHPDVLVALLGHHLAGIVHVPVNTRYRVEEVRHILTDAQPSLVWVDAAHRDLVAAAAPDLPRVSIGDDDPGWTGGPGQADPSAFESPALAGTSPALMIYTSGTTGKSKGVVLSFDAVARNMAALTRQWAWTDRDCLVLALPLFHVHGLCIGLHGAALNGVRIRLLSAFEPAAVVDGIRAGGSIFMGVPTMYQRLLRHMESQPAAADILRRARLFTSGSAPLLPTAFERFETLTGHQIVERYGMSETLITLANTVAEPRRPGAVGRPVPGVEARVVDERGRAVPAGVIGDLEVRGDGLMNEYWRLPDATRTSFTDDGWFKTGDVVQRESDGLFKIVGRRSVDIIKAGGFKISAREIEDVLRDHPVVADAAVVGLPDPEWGQTIAAAVVVQSPEAVPPDVAEELTEYVSTRLADYKRPRRVLVVDELPRNALGKVQKHRVVDMFDASAS